MNDETINIDEQLDILEETKSQIKQAIISKGQSVSDEDSFRSYATKIGNISTLNLQTKSVTPTTQQQVIEPDAPTYNGLSQVTVSGVTSAIDSNIQEGNIKNGVTILGVTGTFNPYQMREYASETEMNNDIANIQEGEVVKVIVVGSSFTFNGVSYPYPDIENFSNISISPSYSDYLSEPLYWAIYLNEDSGKVFCSVSTTPFVYNEQQGYVYSTGASEHYQGATFNGSFNSSGKYELSTAYLGNNLRPFTYSFGNYVPSTNYTSDDILDQNGNIIFSAVGDVIFYLKQTTMKKLVKEEDTLSPADAQQAEEQVADLLGEGTE